MTKSRDPRGIITFIVRYLVLHVVFLAGLPVSYAMGMKVMYFYGFMGFFTFFQVLIAITRKFLEKAGWWKAVAIVGAVFSDVAALWFLGWVIISAAPAGGSRPGGCTTTSSLPCARGDSARSSAG